MNLITLTVEMLPTLSVGTKLYNRAGSCMGICRSSPVYVNGAYAFIIGLEINDYVQIIGEAAVNYGLLMIEVN